MQDADLNVVTGAFGYTGSYIARRLLALGKQVVTLTGHSGPSGPATGQITAFPFDFDSPDTLAEHLRGATTLYNTYWVRFPRDSVTFDRAVENSRALIAAAEEAGVQRIVHVSISNASSSSALPYFKGKGLVEEAILSSKLRYVILRPTVVFGAEDILLNNIAWFLRRFPVFGVPGFGDYRVQPVSVEDLADLAVRLGQRAENSIVDAAGPETYTFEEMVRLMAAAVQSKAHIVHVHPDLALLFTSLASYFVRDVVLTEDEIAGLMAGLLVSDKPATGRASFRQWLAGNASTLGREYRSELARHY